MSPELTPNFQGVQTISLCNEREVTEVMRREEQEERTTHTTSTRVGTTGVGRYVPITEIYGYWLPSNSTYNLAKPSSTE